MSIQEAPITPEIAAAATMLDDLHWLVEEEFDCATCGNKLEPRQQILDVRSELYPGAVETIHLRCYQGEEVRR